MLNNQPITLQNSVEISAPPHFLSSTYSNVSGQGIQSHAILGDENALTDKNVQERIQFESQEFYQIGKFINTNATAIANMVKKSCNELLSFFDYVINKINTHNSYSDESANENKNDNNLNSEKNNNANVKNSESENFEIFETNDLEPYYHVLKEKIDNSLNKANELGKPLMILIGEEHTSASAATIQSMALHIAMSIDKMALKAVLTEQFLSNLYVSNSLPCITVEAFTRYFGLNKIPIDLAQCHTRERWCGSVTAKSCQNSKKYEQLNHESAISEQGMFIRNDVMVKAALDANVGNTVAIVGAAHLCGMISDTPLKKHYHVLTINTHLHMSIFNSTCPDLIVDGKFSDIGETCLSDIDQYFDDKYGEEEISPAINKMFDFIEDHLFIRSYFKNAMSRVVNFNNALINDTPETLRISIPENLDFNSNGTANFSVITPARILQKARETHERAIKKNAMKDSLSTSNPAFRDSAIKIV